METAKRITAAALLLICTLPAAPQGPMVAATPPMGWNSWNLFACKVSDSTVRAAADAMTANGMKQVGYQFINIDDCWQGTRTAAGEIQGNERFPDMKALADYVHSKGLKIGIYSSPGPKTCAGYEGSYQHEEQDARTYAQWGFDYLKYDWCSASKVFQPSDMERVYRKMGDALKSTGRPFVYSLCQYGYERVWEWGPSVGANLWRTTDDIQPNFYSIVALGFAEQTKLEKFAGPGHWNDPDMLEVGNGKLNNAENILHMSLWCLLAAPLLAGNDLANMKPDVLAVLTNPEVIAIDQDPKGVQGHSILQEGPIEIWSKPLADGSTAVGLFNKGQGENKVKVSPALLGVRGPVLIRDLWAHKDLGTFTTDYSVSLSRHSAMLLKVRSSGK
jgi:alpha-galactosidase